jgi:hypothetical protein
MEKQAYNGWSNYATWRVNLEMFDGMVHHYQSEGAWGHNSAKEIAEEIIYEATEEGLGRDYALAFLADVNWHEIAEHYTETEES